MTLLVKWLLQKVTDNIDPPSQTLCFIQVCYITSDVMDLLLTLCNTSEEYIPFQKNQSMQPYLCQ